MSWIARLLGFDKEARERAAKRRQVDMEMDEKVALEERALQMQVDNARREQDRQYFAGQRPNPIQRPDAMVRRPQPLVRRPNTIQIKPLRRLP